VKKLKADHISAVFWAIFALFFMLGSIKLKIGSLGQPGAGFFPFVCSSFILFMAIIVLIQSFVWQRGLQTKVSALWKGVSWHRPAAIGLIMLGYILVVERIGFVLTAFMLLFMLLKIVEKQSWKKTFVTSLLATSACHVIFNIFLKVSLPRGILGF
jgi:putative tricarboxylic transport membrane protein